MMIKVFSGCLLIVLSGLLVAQSSKEEKLQHLKSRIDIKVTELEKDLLKIEYPRGKVLLKNIADFQPDDRKTTIYSPTFDSTIIDLRYIDTTLYYQKYSFWQEVPLANFGGTFRTPLVGDANNNNLPELYGQMKSYTTDYTDIVVLEMNAQGGFDSVYSYNTTNIAISIYDIDKDGMIELHLMRNIVDTVNQWLVHNFPFYRKANDMSLATELSFIFQPVANNNSQQDDNRFGDWDGDEYTDQIFILDFPGMVCVYEYNPINNNFDSVYQYDYTPIDQEFQGFAIEDFDQDEKIEFFLGSTHGDVLSIENSNNNSYTQTWQGVVETYNAYMLAQTNDIDGNGKKEIWVGGDAFYSGIGPMTRITLFESSTDDSYQVVGRIDLVGIFSFYAQNFQAVDVDNDGQEEMMICIEQTVLILKFNGSTNHQTYELFYFKQNDLARSGRNSRYWGAIMYDLNNDNKEEIIINMDEVIQNVGLRLFSFMYKPNFSVDAGNGNNDLPEKFNLYPNYPNPFNLSTKIKFDVHEHSFISIKIYNILGKEIVALVKNELSPGNYIINWEAKDSNGNLLPSGVYFINLSAQNGAEDYTKTLKALLLK